MREFWMFTLLTAQLFCQNQYNVSLQISPEDPDSQYVAFKVASNDSVIYSVIKDVNYLTKLSAIVFDSGTLCLAGSDGLFEFYSNSGKLNRSNDFRNNIIESRSVMKYDADSNSIAIIKAEDDKQSEVYLFDESGNQVFCNTIEDENINGIVNNGYLAAGTSSWSEFDFKEHSTFFSKSGEKLSSVDLSFTGGMFSEDNDKFLGYTNSNLFVADIYKGQVYFNLEMEPGLTIAAAGWSGSNIIFVTAALPVFKEEKWFYYDLNLQTVNLAGEIIKIVELPGGDVHSVEIAKKKKNIRIILDSQEIEVD